MSPTPLTVTLNNVAVTEAQLVEKLAEVRQATDAAKWAWCQPGQKIVRKADNPSKALGTKVWEVERCVDQDIRVDGGKPTRNLWLKDDSTNGIDPPQAGWYACYFRPATAEEMNPTPRAGEVYATANYGNVRVLVQNQIYLNRCGEPISPEGIFAVTPAGEIYSFRRADLLTCVEAQ